MAEIQRDGKHKIHLEKGMEWRLELGQRRRRRRRQLDRSVREQKQAAHEFLNEGQGGGGKSMGEKQISAYLENDRQISKLVSCKVMYGYVSRKKRSRKYGSTKATCMAAVVVVGTVSRVEEKSTNSKCVSS